MKKEDARERARTINKIAQVQTLSGRLLVIGEGMVASKVGGDNKVYIDARINSWTATCC
jgi:hypothetical protein